MSGKTLYFIVDLMQDRALRFQFNRNPKGVMDMYQLDAESQRIVLRMDRDKILERMKSEFEEWGFPDDGFRVHRHCQPKQGGLHYPTPDPEIFQVHAETLSVSNWPTSRRGKILRIYGQSLSEPFTLEITDPSGIALPGLGSPKLRGTFRSSRILVPLPANGSGLKKVKYNVKVTVNPNHDEWKACELLEAFEITA